jgi:hypothetical protein
MRALLVLILLVLAGCDGEGPAVFDGRVDGPPRDARGPDAAPADAPPPDARPSDAPVGG